MSYAPEHTGYFDTIQMYFLEATATGIMFSGRDLALLSRWRSQGATAATVCRGIKEAIANMDEADPPRGVHACRQWIEAEIEHARQAAAGGRQPAESTDPARSNPPDEPSSDPSDTLIDQALANVERAGRNCRREPFRRAYRDAWRAIKAIAEADEVDDPFAELAAIEDTLVDGYFRGLDPPEQHRIEETITQQNRADLAIMSAEARHEHLTARRRRLLIREHGLVPLVE